MLTDKYCEICRKNIDEFDQVIHCPLCGCDFHADHIITWLKTYSSECPACKGLIKRLILPEYEERDLKYEIPRHDRRRRTGNRIQYNQSVCILLCCCISPIVALIYYLLTDKPEQTWLHDKF